MSANFYQTTRCDITEDGNIYRTSSLTNFCFFQIYSFVPVYITKIGFILPWFLTHLLSNETLETGVQPEMNELIIFQTWDGKNFLHPIQQCDSHRNNEIRLPQLMCLDVKHPKNE